MQSLGTLSDERRRKRVFLSIEPSNGLIHERDYFSSFGFLWSYRFPAA